MLDQRFDAIGRHGAIAKQVVVVPDAATESMRMVFKAGFPATGIFFTYGADVDDEVDKFSLNRHGFLPR